MIKYLVVGLGNIGPEYHETRHNIGFMTVEALARINNAPPFIDGRYGFTTSFSVKGRQLILLKPSTFMNLSGFAVRYWMQKENIPLENVRIVVDDLALPFGTLRLKGKGSDAGHNGLVSVMISHVAGRLIMYWDISQMKTGRQWRKGWQRQVRLLKVSVLPELISL